MFLVKANPISDLVLPSVCVSGSPASQQSSLRDNFHSPQSPANLYSTHFIDLEQPCGSELEAIKTH